MKFLVVLVTLIAISTQFDIFGEDLLTSDSVVKREAGKSDYDKPILRAERIARDASDSDESNSDEDEKDEKEEGSGNSGNLIRPVRAIDEAEGSGSGEEVASAPVRFIRAASDESSSSSEEGSGSA